MAKKPRLTVPISTARARLFQLTDFVRESCDDAVVIIEQRGGVESVALVRETRLAYLEERARLADAAQPATPFSLRGSLGSALEDESLDQALRAIRQGWTSSATAVRRKSATPTRRRR